MAPRQKCNAMEDIKSPSPELIADFSSDEEDDIPSFVYCLIEDPITTFVREHVNSLEVKFLVRYDSMEETEVTFSHIPNGCTVQQLVDRLNICLSPSARLTVFFVTHPQDDVNYVVEVTGNNNEHNARQDLIESPCNSDVAESPGSTNNNDVAGFAEEIPASSENPSNEMSEAPMSNQQQNLSVLIRALVALGNLPKYSPTANSTPHYAPTFSPVLSDCEREFSPTSAQFSLPSSSVFARTSPIYSPIRRDYPSDILTRTSPIYFFPDSNPGSSDSMPSTPDYSSSLPPTSPDNSSSLPPTSPNYSPSLPPTSPDYSLPSPAYSSTSAEHSSTLTENWTNHNSVFASAQIWSPTNSPQVSTSQQVLLNNLPRDSPTSPTISPGFTWRPWSMDWWNGPPTYSPSSSVNSSLLYTSSTPRYASSTPTYDPSSPTYTPSTLTCYPSSPTYTPSTPTYSPTSSDYMNSPSRFSRTSPYYMNSPPRYSLTSPLYRFIPPTYFPTSGQYSTSFDSGYSPTSPGYSFSYGPRYLPTSLDYSPMLPSYIPTPTIYTSGSLTYSPASPDNPRDRGDEPAMYYSSTPNQRPQTFPSLTPASPDNPFDRGMELEIKQEVESCQPEVKMEIKSEDDLDDTLPMESLPAPDNSNNRVEVKKEFNRVEVKTEITIKYDFQTGANQRDQLHYPEVKMQIKFEYDQPAENNTLAANSAPAPDNSNNRVEVKKEFNGKEVKTENKRKYDRITEDDDLAADSSLPLNNSNEEKKRKGE